MPLLPIYRDFFGFLSASTSEEELWPNYEELYLRPHRQFLSSYWQDCIGLGFGELRKRVQAIKPSHYSHLLSMLRSYDLEEMCHTTLKKCHELLQWRDEPTVYLMVGFFSPDGFVISVEGKPVIGIGLERYRSFRHLPIILSHEYCHYMQHLSSPTQIDELTLGEALLREGTCIVFSKLVVPDRPLNEYLGISRENVNWMRANEKLIWRTIRPALNLTDKDAIQRYIHGSPPRLDDGAGANTSWQVIPRGSGLYMGFRMAEQMCFPF